MSVTEPLTDDEPAIKTAYGVVLIARAGRALRCAPPARWRGGDAAESAAVAKISVPGRDG